MIERGKAVVERGRAVIEQETAVIERGKAVIERGKAESNLGRTQRSEESRRFPSPRRSGPHLKAPRIVRGRRKPRRVGTRGAAEAEEWSRRG